MNLRVSLPTPPFMPLSFLSLYKALVRELCSPLAKGFSPNPISRDEGGSVEASFDRLRAFSSSASFPLSPLYSGPCNAGNKAQTSKEFLLGGVQVQTPDLERRRHSQLVSESNPRSWYVGNAFQGSFLNADCLIRRISQDAILGQRAVSDDACAALFGFLPYDSTETKATSNEGRVCRCNV